MKTYPPGLPCWAPGAADHLASILTGTECAIEWGGGASSIWLAPKVRELNTVEHDPVWANKIREGCAEHKHVHVHSIPVGDEYVEFMSGEPEPRKIVWLIDGYRRIDCLAYVEDWADAGDIVVCDDALDYAEHLLVPDLVDDIKRFAMPHPYAGTPIDQARHKKDRNTVRTHHAMTKETWIWQV